MRAIARLRAGMSRHALGLWFCGIAVLGLLRAWAAVAREGHAASSPATWPWLLGSALCAIVAVASFLVHGRRSRRLEDRQPAVRGDQSRS
jgi:hypothetical protein